MDSLYNQLEKLRKEFSEKRPSVFSRTQKVYDGTADHVRNYEDRIMQVSWEETIRESEKIDIDEEDNFSSAFKRFLDELKKFGGIKISRESYEILGSREKVNGKGKSKGIFLDEKLIGILHKYDNQTLWYEGEFPEKGIIRLIYDENKQGNKRDDGWNIEFP